MYESFYTKKSFYWSNQVIIDMSYEGRLWFSIPVLNENSDLFHGKLPFNTRV